MSRSFLLGMRNVSNKSCTENQYTHFLFSNIFRKPIPVAARSKAYVCGRSPAEIVGSNPAGGMGVFCCDCCVLSGTGLCDEPIRRPEECGASLCVI